MDDKEIQRMQEVERTYWWHVSRRAILQSVLARHAEFISASPKEILKPVLCQGYGGLMQVQNDEMGDVQNKVKRRKILDVGCGTDNSSPAKGRLGGVDQNDIRILDVGCGTGENFYWLSKFGEVTGADTSELAVELASQKGTAVLGRAEDLPFEDNTFNLITAFDILEHVTDEERVLGEWGRVLRPQGLLFVSVPAYQWLFGPHDRALEHLRRYNVPQLKQILIDNDFEMIFASHFFALTFPIFLLQRGLVKFSRENVSQYVNVPMWLNNFLISLGKAEASWLKCGKFPFGSSIVVLARKIDQPRNI